MSKKPSRRVVELGLGPTTPVPNLSGKSRDKRIQAMVEWFGENFEDPSQHTPYNGQEGGFQYIWGGPYNASAELEDAFSGKASQDEIDAAVEEVESDATFDWAPAQSRILPEDDYDEADEFRYRGDMTNDMVFDPPEDERTTPDTRDKRAQEVRSALSELEAAIKEWKEDRPLLGHNQPPSAISPDLSVTEVSQIETGILVVRQELDKPVPDLVPVQNAESTFRQVLKRIMAITGLGIGIFFTGILNAAGEAAYGKLAIKLAGAADAIAAWAATFSSF